MTQKFPSSSTAVMMVLISISFFNCGLWFGRFWRHQSPVLLPPIAAVQKTTTDNVPPHTNEKNIVFIKVPKVGGSTFSGVLRRAATKLHLSGTRGNEWINGTNEPGLWASHTPFKQLIGKIDDLKKSKLLLTMVRSPENRALSAFYYFEATKKKTADTDRNIIDYLKKVDKDYMLKYINNWNASVASTTSEYNFIGVTERFDESVLALKHLLNVTLEDVLYIASKDSHKRKHLQQPSRLYEEQSNIVTEYINKKFLKIHNRDVKLYQAANRKLDQYISSIPNFDIELAILRSMLKTANNVCNQGNNNRKDCYFRDNGCGIECLNKINVSDYLIKA